jgi:hypothetical protein
MKKVDRKNILLTISYRKYWLLVIKYQILTTELKIELKIYYELNQLLKFESEFEFGLQQQTAAAAAARSSVTITRWPRCDGVRLRSYD